MSVQVLCLRGLGLKADSMAVLAANGPKSLMALDLQDNQLDAAAMYQLAQGSWHDLNVLKLSGNNLDDDAMGHLSTGAWPTLSSLEVFRNLVTFNGLQRLATADFLCTETLAVTEQEMSLSPLECIMMLRSGRKPYAGWKIEYDHGHMKLQIEHYTEAHIGFKIVYCDCCWQSALLSF